MQLASLPLDVLADELGAAAGRIERELRLQDEARAARFEARLAAIELASLKAEEQRDRHFNGILDLLEARVAACIAKVKDGEPGRDGKDADIEPLFEMYRQTEAEIGNRLGSLEEHLQQKIHDRLGQIRDGKDGEPGKDADIEPLWDAFNQREASIGSAFVDLEEKIDERLAQLKDGKDGEPGPEGSAGKDGKDGKLPIAREWTNRVHYEGDVVRHNGATYQALTDTGQRPPHSDWGELASRGTDGIGFVLRGTYDAAAEYRQHDIVMINRNSFAAKYDNPGECPGDGWQLFGPSGQRGKEGPPGIKGNDGRSVSIASLEADADAMVLRITDSLGKTFELDIHPIAERIVEAAR